MPGSSWTACRAAISAREISRPVASPPAWAIRSRWWPPSRVREISPVRAAVELGAEADQLAHPGGPLGDEGAHRLHVADPGAGDQGVVQVLLRRVGRVQGRGDAALGPLRGPLGEHRLGHQQHPLHPLPQPQRRGQAGDARADDDHVGRGRPARRRRDQPAGDGERHRSPPAAGTGCRRGAGRRCGPSRCGREDLERAAAGPDRHREVVDQAGRADLAGHRQQRLAAVPLGHVLQGGRVHQDQVVDQGQRLAGRGPHAPRGGRRRGPRRRPRRRPAAPGTATARPPGRTAVR